MDIEKAKRDAQEQVDRALAEVDRLKGVSKDLEVANKKASADYDVLSTSIKQSIDELKKDESEAKVVAVKAKAEATKASEERRVLLAEIDSRREDLVAFESRIIDKKNELDELESLKSKKIASINAEIEAKNIELKQIETKIETTTALFAEERAKLNTTLNSLQARITEYDKIIEERHKESAGILSITKRLQSDATHAEIQKEKAEAELKSIELQKAEILKKIDEKTADLAQTKEDLIKVKAEIEPLEARRIASITFMEELRNKESNLKAMYEKVGMEFPA